MKAAKASTDSSCEKTGRVWIWVKKEIPNLKEIPILKEAIVDIKLVVVDELIDATILRTSDAEQVTQRANQQHSKYLWRAVPAKRTGKFVVQGDLRANSSRLR